MKMSRDQLQAMLRNRPLVQAIAQKREIDSMKKKLWDALQILRETDVIESAVAAVQAKCNEYSKVSQGYGNLLEELWGISWQMEEVIAKHIDLADREDWEIDQLPEIVE